MDFSEMTHEGVLRAYSSVKGHRTRCEREINSLIDMLKVQYSAPSEVRVNDRLEKLEKHTHKLSDITLDEAATAIFRVIHERHAAVPQAAVAEAPAPAQARAPIKPSAVHGRNSSAHTTTPAILVPSLAHSNRHASTIASTRH